MKSHLPKPLLFVVLFASFTAVPTLPDSKQAFSKPRLIVDTKWEFLLGAFWGGRWIKTPEAQRWARGGENYAVFHGPHRFGTFRGGKAVVAGPHCPNSYLVKVHTPPYKPKGLLARRAGPPGYIGVSGASVKQLLPRPVQMPGSQAYRGVVASWLRAHGIQNPQPGIIKVWRVDLDNDGRQEVLINAVRHEGYNGWPQIMSFNSHAGDHALLLVRRAEKAQNKGAAKTTAVFSQIHVRAASLNAPAILELAAVLDINGDGKMEIITRGRYYQGQWGTVYEWRNGYPKEVLSSGCGV